MSQTEPVEQSEVRKNDPAFGIDNLDISSGEVVVVIQKGILGALSNQLKSTSNRRKGSSILRKLGHTLADCGDVLYGGDISETDLDPSLVTDQDEE